MPWWGWIIFGALLFGSELMIIDAAFYLVFIGLAAIITGLVDLLGLSLEYWAQWMLFASLSLVSMVLFRQQLYEKLRGGSGPGYVTGPAGETIKLAEELAPGDSCRMSYRGTNWTVLNAGADAMASGENVRINSVDGLTLKVQKLKTASEEME
jgi:membrane protein implicated in regulation of membrane protease activity